MVFLPAPIRNGADIQMMAARFEEHDKVKIEQTRHHPDLTLEVKLHN